MPRRAKADPLALAVGQRIRQLREEVGLTAERLVFDSEIGSKGYLSDIEHGLASPSLRTLGRIADYLRVEVVDLVTFPEQNERQRLIDRTRAMPLGVMRRLLRDTAPAAARLSQGLLGSAEGRTLLVSDSRTPSRLGSAIGLPRGTAESAVKANASRREKKR